MRYAIKLGPVSWIGRLLAAAVVPALIGCADQAAQPAPDLEPGLYDLKLWYGGDKWPQQDYAESIDIDGKVGHPINTGYTSARCEPTRHWSHNSRIVSGQLPPGLSLSSSEDISGIPTKRGHWIVRMEAYNIECNDLYYGPYQQELRFHITGTGKVIQ